MSRNPTSDVLSHNALLILITCSLLYFITLGAREVQPYEESMNALRAKAIVETGQWSDQTDHALGGLQSASKAPFPVWAMAFFMKPMRSSTLSIRLASTLCGIASMFLMYGIACLIMPRKIGIIAAVLLCASLSWNHYSRLGTADIPFLTATLLAFYAILRSLHTRDAKQSYFFAAVFAFAVFIAGSSYLIATLIPLSFVVILFIKTSQAESEGLAQPNAALRAFAHEHRERGHLGLVFSAAAVLGTILSLWWYVGMALRHGNSMWNALAEAVPGLAQIDGWWSIGSLLNALIVSQPLTFFAPIWVFFMLRYPQQIFLHAMDPRAEKTLALWFCAVLLVSSFLPAAAPGSALLALPPAILLSLRGLDVLMQLKARSRSGVVIMVLALLCCVWSIAQPLRVATLNVVQGHGNLVGLSTIVLAVLALVIAIQQRMERRLTWTVHLHRFASTLLPILLVLRVALLNFYSIDDCHRGAQKVTKWLHDADVKSCLVLVHRNTPADTLASQLAWYSQGWIGYGSKSPWQNLRNSTVIHLGAGVTDSTLIELLDTAHVPIVYIRPADDSLCAREVRQLQRLQKVRLQTQSYTIFSRRSYSGTMEGLELDFDI